MAMLFLTASAGFAQWQYAGVFPDTTKALGLQGQRGGIHGIAVDPEGKVWVVNYYANKRDSIFIQNLNKYISVRTVTVYNPDGTLHKFPEVENPIFFYREMQNGKPVVIDTIGGKYPWDANSQNTGRGCKMDGEGNIVATIFGIYYKFDYKTGIGLGKVSPQGAGGTSAAFSRDENNKMFTATVAPGNPIREYDKNGSLIGNAVEKSKGYSRNFEVSADGNKIYWAGYSLHYIQIYSRTDEFGTFDSTDFWPGFDAESFCWDTKFPNWLWVNAGSGNDKANQYVGVTTTYTNSTWYGIDAENFAVKDSINWKFSSDQDPAKMKTRGIAFSPTGDTAYVVMYEGTKDNVNIQRFINPNRTTGVDDQQTAGVVENYSLSQNYPNPFNPMTRIDYSLAKAGFVSIKVYNMLGQEVATLVNREMSAGSHFVGFNASNLPSGSYVYELNANGVRLSKKLMLVK